MKKYTYIKKIMKIVEKEMLLSGHKMDHINRVLNMALQIAEKEGNINYSVLVPAVLLHDIGRNKADNLNIPHAIMGAKMANDILKDFFPLNKRKKIIHCIKSHSLGRGNKPKTIEAMILFDADKIDSLGAIGIARTFMFGGYKNDDIYIPYSLYKEKLEKTAPNIFFNKRLKKIPELLYTETAKNIAKQRYEFMVEFFNKLEDECTLEHKIDI